MIRLFSALLCLVVSASAFAQDYSYKVVYSGGSLASVRSGADATLYVETTVVRIVVDHLNVVSIPSNTITQIAFGEEVPRTLGSLITLGKQKKHLVGFTWLTTPSAGVSPSSAQQTSTRESFSRSREFPASKLRTSLM